MPRRSARLAAKPRRDYAKMAGVRPRRRRAAAPPSFAQKVMAVVHKNEETKYVASVVALNEPADTLAVPTDLRMCLPKVAQGVGSNQRIGQKIDNAHGKVQLTFILNPDAGSAATISQDVIVRVYTLTSKQAKSAGQVALLPGNTLLDNGDQTTTDWNTAANALGYAQQPLSKEDFSGKFREVRLTKNFGKANSGTASDPTLTYGKIFGRVSLPWKHKSNLLYDDQGTNYPTNYAPIYAYVAYNSDGSLFKGQVQVVTRLHMWFKDV